MPQAKYQPVSDDANVSPVAPRATTASTASSWARPNALTTVASTPADAAAPTTATDLPGPAPQDEHGPPRGQRHQSEGDRQRRGGGALDGGGDVHPGRRAGGDGPVPRRGHSGQRAGGQAHQDRRAEAAAASPPRGVGLTHGVR